MLCIVCQTVTADDSQELARLEAENAGGQKSFERVPKKSSLGERYLEKLQKEVSGTLGLVRVPRLGFLSVLFRFLRFSAFCALKAESAERAGEQKVLRGYLKKYKP